MPKRVRRAADERRAATPDEAREILAEWFSSSLEGARQSFERIGISLGYRTSPETMDRVRAALAEATAALRDGKLTVCIRRAPPAIMRAQHHLARNDAAFQRALSLITDERDAT